MSAQGLHDCFAPLEASQQVQHRKPSHCATAELFLSLGSCTASALQLCAGSGSAPIWASRATVSAISPSAITTRSAAGRAIAIA
jgi:hypothetical protein